MNRTKSGRDLPEHEIREMVEIVLSRQVAKYSLADLGTTPVYFIEDDLNNRYILKSSLGEKIEKAQERLRNISAEARVLRLLEEFTAIPVPSVIGVVDNHDYLQTPFFLMEEISGDSIPPCKVDSISNEELYSISYDIGKYLTELHNLTIDGLYQFGYLNYDYNSLHGGVPDINPDRFYIENGYASWKERIRAWFKKDLDQLRSTRFRDLTPQIATEFENLIAEFPNNFSPVIGRVHQGTDNIIIDTESKNIKGLIDWEPRHVVPAAFDLSVVEFSLCGSEWMSLPRIQDRRDLVGEALISGYKTAKSVPECYSVQRDCYHLDNFVLSMIELDNKDMCLSEFEYNKASRWLRRAVNNLLE